MEKGVGSRFATDDIFCTGDMSKCLVEARLFQNQLNFVSQRAGGNGEWIPFCGFSDEFADAGKDRQMLFDSVQICESLVVHQLRKHGGCRLTMVLMQGGHETTAVVKTKVVGVVLRLREGDIDPG